MLAVTAHTRLVAAPEFPTAAESGFPGLTLQGTVGLLAPKGTPKPFIEPIAQTSRTALTERAYQDFLIEAGFEPALDSTPKKLQRTLEQDVALWTPDRQTARVNNRRKANDFPQCVIRESRSTKSWGGHCRDVMELLGADRDGACGQFGG